MDDRIDSIDELSKLSGSPIKRLRFYSDKGCCRRLHGLRAATACGADLAGGCRIKVARKIRDFCA